MRSNKITSATQAYSLHPGLCRVQRKEKIMAKRKSTQQGTAVIFLETDLQRSRKTEESNYTPLQTHCFNKLSSVEQEKIRAGHGTLIVDLESESSICEFNTEEHHFPEGSFERYARVLLPQIQEYFSKEENRREFEEYMKEQNRHK